MKERKMEWKFLLVTLLSVIVFFPISSVKAAEPVIIACDGEEQKEYTTVDIGEIIMLDAWMEGEVIHEIVWLCDAPDIAAITEDEDTVHFKAFAVGTAKITAKVTTDSGELEKDLVIYTRADPESMVYAEEASWQDFEEDRVSVLNARAAKDVTITFDGEERVNYTTLSVDDTRVVKAYVEGETIQNIQWSSDKPKVLSISGDKDSAVIEGKSIGVATITAKITTNLGTVSKDIMISTRTSLDLMGYANADTDMHRAANESSSISNSISKGDVLKIQGQNGNYYWVSYDDMTGFVRKSRVNIPAADVTLNKNYITMKIGDRETLSAVISPNLYTGAITWKSNQDNIATVNGNGQVTGKTEGAARVRAVAEGINGSIQAECIVSIWTSLPEAKALTTSMVNGNTGAVSGAENTGSIAAGTAVTIVGQCSGYYYVRKTDGSLVFVEKNKLRIPVAKIDLDIEELTIGIGQTYRFFADVFPEIATDKTIKWSSDNANIVTIDQSGKITAIRTGNAYIEAKSGDGSVSAKCSITVQTEPVYDIASIRRVEIVSTKVKYNFIQIYFEAKATADMEVVYQVLYLGEKGNVEFKHEFQSDETNKKIMYNLKGPYFNKSYAIQVSATYIRNGKKETKSSQKVTVRAQKALLSISLNKMQKDSFSLNLNVMPKSYYEELAVYYRKKGDGKYSLLNKKHYKVSKNTIKIEKDLISGKTYEFEVRLLLDQIVICKEKVSITRGYTKVKTALNKARTKINLSWDKIAFAKGYDIYRSEKKGILGTKIQTIKKAATTNYSDPTKKLKKGKKYYYQVVPYWTTGKKTQKGKSNKAEIVCKK